MLSVDYFVSIYTFTATEVDEFSSGKKPCQGNDVSYVMMEAEMASEALGFCSQLTRLFAVENFIISPFVLVYSEILVGKPEVTRMLGSGIVGIMLPKWILEKQGSSM